MNSGTGCYRRIVIFHQFLNDDLGCACYLVGDEEAGIAVRRRSAVRDRADPRGGRAARRPRSCARSRRTPTPTTSPGTAGSRSSTGSRSACTPRRASTTRTTRCATATRSRSARVTLGVIHTPGHRPEHCCLTVVDRSRADEPWLVLTGDSLFVGDAARPDLAVGAVEGAEGLFHSLRRLLELADGVEVFPGHVAGSLCGKSMSSKPSTTIGFERRFNPALQLDEVDAFVAESAVDQRSEAAEPRADRRERTAARSSAPPPLAQELAAPPDDAQLLDVRPVAAHLAGHRPGAISVPVSGTSFATKAGFVLDAGAPGVRARGDRRRGPAGDPRAPLGRVLRHRRLRARRRRRADRHVSRSTSSRP